MKRQNQSLQYLEQGKNVLSFVMANCNIDIPSEKVHIFIQPAFRSDNQIIYFIQFNLTGDADKK